MESYEEDSDYAAFVQQLEEDIQNEAAKNQEDDEHQTYVQARQSVVDRVTEKYITKGGIVSTYADKTIRDEKKARRELRKYIAETKKKFEEYSELYEEAKVRVAYYREHVNKLAFERTRAERSLSNFENSTKFQSTGERASLLQGIDDADFHYKDMEATFEKEREKLVLIEKTFGELKLEVEANAIAEQELNEIEQNELQERELIARLRIQNYERIQQSKEKKMMDHQQKLMAHKEKELEILQEKVQKSNEARAKISALSKDLAARVKSAEMERQRVHNEVLQRKQASHVELHRNTEKAKSQIKAKIEKKQKKEALQQKQQQEEMTRIAIAGGNPYEIIREKQEREKYEKHIRQIKQKQEQRLAHIQKIIAEENARLSKMQHKETKEKAILKDFHESQISKKAQDKRVADYIASRTVSGADIIDPLRKQIIMPSKVMVVKDHTFGLGGTHLMNTALLERMVERHKDVTFDEKIVKTIKLGDARPSSPQERSQVLDFDQESDEELGVPEIDGLW